MQTFKPNEQRARIAILFSWILMALTALSLVSSVLQYTLLDSWVNGAAVDEAAAAANDMREGIIGALVLIVNIIWAVLLLMWFYRAFANLQTRVSYPLSCKPGWAVGNFFIPIVCLYRPYQTMKELYVDTRELFVNDGLTEKSALRTTWVGWWWTLWIITAFVTRIVLKMAFRETETIDDFVSLTIAQIVEAGLTILEILLTIIVISDYSRVEPMLAGMDEGQKASDISTE